MSTELAKPNALNALALRVQCDPAELISTLKSTVFKGASDAEFSALVIIANTYELNPILKELYAFPAKGGGIVPVVGIDGWLKIINRQPNFDGMTVETSDDGQSATATIHVKGRAHPTIVTEYLSECSRGTEPWKTMPRRMLRHKAIIQCARVAFGIGGVQDEDEANDTAMRDVTPVRTPAKRETPNIPGNPAEHADTPPAKDDRPPAIPPTGRQKKERLNRMASLTGITERTGNGKTWWAVGLKIGASDVEMTTFSESMHRSLADCEKGSKLWITFTKSEKGYALEDYTLQVEEEEGLV
ncbi:MAG: phage recombination protein Bet [Luteolibacter sp.]